MMEGGALERGRSYCILRGETIAGETVEIRPIKLTNALYSRTWTMVNATIGNQSFKLASVHPGNEELIRQFGGVENLPRAVRLPDLLQAWGELYNNELPASSSQRLKAIRIDLYRWDSGTYDDYSKFVETWRKEL